MHLRAEFVFIDDFQNETSLCYGLYCNTLQYKDIYTEVFKFLIFREMKVAKAVKFSQNQFYKSGFV